MKYVAFDLEIADEIPEGDRITNFNLGITCAATITENGPVKIWHDDYAPRMSQEYAQFLVSYLASQATSSRPIVTWNGLGFDFRVLAAASGQHDICRALAIAHIDIPFQLFCDRGFMVGIAKAAAGMGIGGKTEGMTGAAAPQLWKQGQDAQDKVLEYVGQDAKMTGEVYEKIIAQKQMSWITRAGRRSAWYPKLSESGNLLTVSESNQLPIPDTSWMDNPWTRDRFYNWSEEARHD